MSIIKGIFRSKAPTLEIGGRARATRLLGGGGSSNDAVLPAGPLSMSSSENSIAIVLSNSGSTPASVECSFSNNYLQGVDPDQGTASSPTWVIDPDTPIRTIYLERGSVTPPSSPSDEVVTFTGNSGVIGTLTVSIELPLYTYIDGFSPTHMFNYDSTADAGSAGGTLTLTNTSVGSDTSVPGLIGSLLVNAVSDRAQANVTGSNLDANSSDRTCLMVWSTIGSAFTSNTIQETVGSHHLFPFKPETDGTTVGTSYYRLRHGTGQNTNFALNTGSHTDGGAVESMTLEADSTYILAVSWAQATATLTVRWKKTGDRAGSSYRTGSRTATAGSNNASYIIAGADGFYSNAQRNVRHRFFSVFDSVISESEFNNCCSIIGL